jgi:hypothetical protein
MSPRIRLGFARVGVQSARSACQGPAPAPLHARGTSRRRPVASILNSPCTGQTHRGPGVPFADAHS